MLNLVKILHKYMLDQWSRYSRIYIFVYTSTWDEILGKFFFVKKTVFLFFFFKFVFFCRFKQKSGLDHAFFCNPAIM